MLAVAAVLLALWPALAAPALAPPDLRGGLLVAYTPLGYAPGPSWRPRAAGLRADADDLRRIGAVAVVTERATRALAPVCRFLKRRGIQTVIVGVADPTDAAELRVARRLRRCADGYAVGSGGLASRRYARRPLERAVAALRRDTGRPVALRERIESYRADPGLLGLGDWVFPLVDADPRHGAQEACGATMHAYQTLRARLPPDRRVVLGAAGLPTAIAPAANEHAQRAYLTCLASREISFVHDEAYDQPWRGGAGTTRGLFRADGTPKLLAWQLARPRLAVDAPRPALAGRVLAATPSRYHLVVYVRGARWEPQPPRPLSRGGRWQASIAGGQPAVALLAAVGFVPADALDRPPVADGVRVFAVADLGGQR